MALAGTLESALGMVEERPRAGGGREIDLPTLLSRWGLDGLISMNLATGLLLVGSGVVFYRLRKAEETGLASLAMVVSAIFAYHRHYDLVLLLPASAWLASRSLTSWRSVVGAWA